MTSGIPALGAWESHGDKVTDASKNKRKTFANEVMAKHPTTVHYSYINNNKDVRLSDWKLISLRAQLRMPLSNHLGPLTQGRGFHGKQG